MNTEARRQAPDAASAPARGTAVGDVWADAAIVFALLAAEAAFLVAFIPGYFDTAAGGDYPYYARMAASLEDPSVPSPWRFRVLNPLLARGLMAFGLSAHAAFFTLTFLFALASSVLMSVFLRQLALSPRAARVGAVLFAASVGGYTPLRRYFGYPDAIANFLLLAALVSLAAGRRGWLAASLGVGALAKENALLLLPFLFVRVRAWAAPIVSSGVLAAPVVVWILLRVTLAAPDGGASLALSVEAQLAYWREAMVHGVVRWILWAVAYSMGPLWPIAAVAALRNRRFVAGFALYILVLVLPLVRTTDTERALMLLFPLVLPLVAWAIDDSGRHGRRVALLTLACTLAAQLTYEWSPAWRPGPVNAKDLTFAALALAPAVAAVRWRGSARAAPLGWPPVRWRRDGSPGPRGGLRPA